MPQSLTNLYVHMVFATKDRKAFISTELEPALYAFLGGIARDLKCTLTHANGMEDHVHLLINQHPSISVSDLAKELKSRSSLFMKRQGIVNFSWQAGYGAFGVGEEAKKSVVQYIRRQKEHHSRTSLDQELCQFAEYFKMQWDLAIKAPLRG